MRAPLALAILACAESHYVWQTVDSGATPATTSLTFSENGLPGPSMFLKMIASNTTMYAQQADNSSARQLLNFAEHDGKAGSALVAPLPAGFAAPFALETYVPFGVFHEAGPPSLLQFYATAPSVTAPHDWWRVQAVLQNKLEITVRDPYMRDPSGAPHAVYKSRAARQRGADPADHDQCPPGQGTYEGDACVVAVVRFEGDPLNAAVNVTTFDGDTGKKIRVGSCNNMGMLILRVPVRRDGAPTRILASVNFREMTPGTFHGAAYEFVDHWATTSATIARPGNASALIV